MTPEPARTSGSTPGGEAERPTAGGDGALGEARIDCATAGAASPDDQREAGRFIGRSAAGLVAVLLAALAVAALLHLLSGTVVAIDHAVATGLSAWVAPHPAAVMVLEAIAVIGMSVTGELPPTSSFPSSHTAAASCLYGGIAALVLCNTRARWRWPAVAAAALVVLAVAAARLYRGAHFPTDVAGSILFAIPWLMVTVALLQPRNIPTQSRSRSGPGRLNDRRPLGDG